MNGWPEVCAVIPTRDRMELLGEAVESVLAQHYPGRLTVVVVLDRTPEHAELPDVVDDDRVRILPNNRSPGLAGARNTGICATNAPLVAFCDDDDVWLPGKLTAQVAELLESDDASFVTCSVEVRYGEHATPRTVGGSRVTHVDLLHKRMAMLHSSTFVIRREALLGPIGLLGEDLPGSQNEDWDLLLRASAVADILHVDEPLVAVRWWARSYFSGDWATKISSLEAMLVRHPDIRTDRPGAARVYGQIGFAHAAMGHRRTALRWAARGVRARAAEPRAYLAVLVAAGAPAGSILAMLHRRGRGV